MGVSPFVPWLGLPRGGKEGRAFVLQGMVVVVVVVLDFVKTQDASEGRRDHAILLLFRSP